ncbi:NAD-dependent epimerase/dehydratase family protein [Pseudooctadecabacter sp.]|uniref:NAD-dependent epimerase/dehydratase family protein n=1 Tax=Pseudooctadecabacter sp. TaxID=1966338 RepID=UPI003F6C987A
MQTVILGAQGKLGGVLHRHARRAGLGWLGQGRREGVDLLWSPDCAPRAEVFPAGGTVINMIGRASPDEKALRHANIELTRQILHHATAHGVAHVVLASSAAVYGNAADGPVAETATLSPLIPYGHSKAEMEAVAADYAQRPDSPALTILRIGNVAGSDALTAIARQRCTTGEPMDLHRFPDGAAPVRSYIGPRDLFDVVTAVAQTPPASSRILNVAAPTPVDLEAVMTAYQTHFLPDLRWQDTPVPNGVPKQVILSTQALERLIHLPSGPDYAAKMALQVKQDLAP